MSHSALMYNLERVVIDRNFYSVQKTQKNLNEKIVQLMQLLMMCLHS
jgi:hypothetical protein